MYDLGFGLDWAADSSGSWQIWNLCLGGAGPRSLDFRRSSNVASETAQQLRLLNPKKLLEANIARSSLSATHNRAAQKPCLRDMVLSAPSLLDGVRGCPDAAK